MPPARYYVTTSIPYVNARPHLGHALEFVQADVLARYHRLRGDDTRFLTGTDDNAMKNVQAAEAAGVPVQAFVDANAAHFAALRAPLALSPDDFIRTSGEERHRAGVWKLWHACGRAGDIDRRAYRGLYCLGCEQFYTADELADGRCPVHGRPPEAVEEENYFFRLSRYQAPLLEAIRSNALRILPETRRVEMLRFIERGLVDFSISRSRMRARGWGIPVPGDPEQVMYVWFDALGNYITALDGFDFRAALEAIWILVTRANQYVEETAPWRLARRQPSDAGAARRLDTVLYTLAEVARLLAVHLTPFMPQSAARLGRSFGQTGSEREGYVASANWGRLAPGITIAPPEPIYPRIEP
jgi:methionyl-tRNA synthetase